MASPSTSATTDPYAAISTPTPSALASAQTPSGADPYAAISTPTPPPAPGTTGVLGAINKVGETAADIATHPLDTAAGFVKGAGDTVSGISHILNKIPVIGETLAPSQGISSMDKMDEANGVAEAAGKGLEGIAEFAAGDELLSGLSKGAKLVALAQKYPIVAKTLELATAHPWLAKIITEGGKGAVTGAVEGGVKGAQKGQAVEGAVTGAERGGATGAALGAVTGAAEKYAASKVTPPNPYRETSKIEPHVAKQVAKADLPAGDAGVTVDAAKAANTQAKIDAQAATQKNIDNTIQSIANEHANVHGLPAPAAGTATRDVMNANGEALVNSAKADYKLVDKYTNNGYTNAQQELKNAQDEMKMGAGRSDVDTGQLELNVGIAQHNVESILDQAVKNGMQEDLAEQARAKFKIGQATLDVAHDVRMANKVRDGVRSTDLNALENRLQARFDSGRLQQAFGGDTKAAQDVLTRVHAAREVAQELQSMPPTESKALQELIENHTTTGKLGATTNWVKLREEFSQLPDRGARFSDVPRVERFINNQAALQRAIKWGSAAVASVPVLGGMYEAGHSILGK